MKVAITSNWHFSEITKFAKTLISKTTNTNKEGNNTSNINKKYKHYLDNIIPNMKIIKSEIEYNKKQEVLTIDPPLQELPHALQITHSTGLLDLNNASIEMDQTKQTKSRVSITVKDTNNAKAPVSINSNLNMGDKLDKKRERLLKIYLNDKDDDPDIIVGYDAQFENGICAKKASIEYDVETSKKRIHWKKEIDEDNMDIMYENIYDSFANPKQKTLTLEEYAPVANCIYKSQEMWKKCTEQNKTKPRNK